MSSGRDIELLEIVLRLIDGIERRLSGLTEGAFILGQDEIDLTAYRLAMIGEETGRLSDAIKQNYSLPWKAIYRLRNIVVHNYNGIDPRLRWQTARQGLGALAEICRKELSDQRP